MKEISTPEQQPAIEQPKSPADLRAEAQTRQRLADELEKMRLSPTPPVHTELSKEEKTKLKEKTGWSNEVVNNIHTVEQADIYQRADLHQENVNGRTCLVKEIDYDYVDDKTGMTNRELMAKGRSPYDAKTGEKIELHHMGQKSDAPFAELTENSEHGDGNHSTLHPKTDSSWRNDEGLEAQYRKEKREHWKTRSEV